MSLSVSPVFFLMCLAVASAAAQSMPSEYQPYGSCKFSDGLTVVDTTPLAAGVKARSIRTEHGSYALPLSSGERLMFAYPGEDFYANVKVETLPAATYAQSKAALVEDFDLTLASAVDSSRNYKLKPVLNGFDIRGLDRSKREDGVLGIYLLFDDRTHIVTTIDFLNQEPPKRFTTMEQYGVLRDRFLNEYTHCIHAR